MALQARQAAAGVDHVGDGGGIGAISAHARPLPRFSRWTVRLAGSERRIWSPHMEQARSLPWHRFPAGEERVDVDGERVELSTLGISDGPIPGTFGPCRCNLPSFGLQALSGPQQCPQGLDTSGW